VYDFLAPDGWRQPGHDGEEFILQVIETKRHIPFEPELPLVVNDAPTLSPSTGEIGLNVHENLPELETEWRAFEAYADGTVFQSFDWLSTWQRHIGALDGTMPAIVVGRDTAGKLLFLFPLSIRPGGIARRLEWLGSDLCDYNAPLLAPEFSDQFDRSHFTALWDAMIQALQNNPRLRFDFISLAKMPELVGEQRNPMLYLPVTMNPSGAYLAHLSGDWETFYSTKRSSATRRRDRTKRKRLSEIGLVKLVNPEHSGDTERMLETLMAQKARQFARMGVANLFGRPGHAAFYRALATNPATRHLVHVSSLNVGDIPAAINLGLTYGGRYYHLLASYDEGAVSRFGPGAAHLHDLLQYAITHGFKVFDFTIGDERYKRDWCDTEVKLYDAISAATWRGSLAATPAVAMQRLKRWIKQTPALWSLFSRAREIIGSMRRRSAAGDVSDV
jgi:CelD/BcsL family acetyltransferase involved in cellulose biosynthesis